MWLTEARRVTTSYAIIYAYIPPTLDPKARVFSVNYKCHHEEAARAAACAPRQRGCLGGRSRDLSHRRSETMRGRSTVAVLSASAVGAAPGDARPDDRDMLDLPPPRRRMHSFHLPVAVHRPNEPESAVLPSGEIDGGSLLQWRL